jgi:hypothetical protein
LEVLLGKIKSTSKAKRCGSENRNNDSKQGIVIGCCNHGKKKNREFLEYLSYRQLLKKKYT